VEDTFKINLNEIACESVDWIKLIQDRLLWTW